MQLLNIVGASSPSWSPDGSKIAFERGNDIWIMDANGRNYINLTSDAQGHERSPSWSPDGKSLLFCSDRLAFPLGDFDIFRVNIESRKIRRVTDFPGWELKPRCSPDGEKIAFAFCRADGPTDIYVMDASGGDVTRLTETPWTDTYPVWSPPLLMAVTSAGKMTISWGKIKSGGL